MEAAQATRPTLLFRDGQPRLQSGRLKPREAVQTDWFAEIPVGTTLEAVMEPGFWVHCVRDLQPRSTIRVVCEDDSWGCDLYVHFISSEGVRVKLWPIVPDDLAEDDYPSALHEIKWQGTGRKYAILDKTSNIVIRDGFPSKADAASFLSKHLKRME